MTIRSLFLGDHEYKEGMHLVDTLKTQAGKHLDTKARYPTGMEKFYERMIIFYKVHYPEHQVEIWISLLTNPTP